MYFWSERLFPHVSLAFEADESHQAYIFCSTKVHHLHNGIHLFTFLCCLNFCVVPFHEKLIAWLKYFPVFTLSSAFAGNVTAFVVLQRGNLKRLSTCAYLSLLALADTGEMFLRWRLWLLRDEVSKTGTWWCLGETWTSCPFGVCPCLKKRHCSGILSNAMVCCCAFQANWTRFFPCGLITSNFPQPTVVLGENAAHSRSQWFLFSGCHFSTPPSKKTTITHFAAGSWNL